MAQAVTAFEAFGFERDEVVTKRFKQVAKLTVSGANTDITYDIGANAGTFWTAAGGTALGAAALAALKAIQGRASTYLGVKSPTLEGKAQIGLQVKVIAGTVAAGSASAAVTATGLLSAAHGDTILAVTQDVKGANSLPLLGYNTQADDALTAVYSADPGANATVKITVLRGSAATTAPVPVAGQFKMSVENSRPDIVFATGDAPTSMVLWMEWDLQNDQIPIVYPSP